MLKINKELWPRFNAAYKFACSIGARKSFIRAIRYAQWGENTGKFDCVLYPDQCSHSFGFKVVQKKGDGCKWLRDEHGVYAPKDRIFGGIIFHEDSQTWGVHT